MALCRCSIWRCFSWKWHEVLQRCGGRVLPNVCGETAGAHYGGQAEILFGRKEKIRGNHGVDPGKIGTFGTGDCTKTE